MVHAQDPQNHALMTSLNLVCILSFADVSTSVFDVKAYSDQGIALFTICHRVGDRRVRLVGELSRHGRST